MNEDRPDTGPLRAADRVLARNTFWVAFGQVLRVGIQAVYFILIARALGAREYGLYVGVLALVAVAAPFASLGSGNLLIKHVARDPDTFPRHWGKALTTTLLTGTLLLGLVAVVARLWLPASVPLRFVLVIGAADLLFVRLIDVSAQAYQAHQRMSRTALLQLLLSPVRLLAALVMIAVVPAPTALEWGALYLLSAVIGGCVAVALVNHELGKPEFRLRHLSSELGEGAYFSVSLSAMSFTNDIDKTMLARLSTLEATGIYAAAYRLVDVAFLPVMSLLMATYAQFFQHGVRGVRATARFARRLLSLGAGYGLLAAAGLYLVAPALPVILGDGYRDAIDAVRWLALLPFLKAIHYFGADALTGAGHQGYRTVVQVGIAALNILLNLWLIPLYSWRGAAIATIVSDGLMGVAIWSLVWYLARHGGRLRSPDEIPSVVEVG
jgi:O-antigen/teichoic acid export membrane protein